jgi:L-lactate dehydrogenase complex protein LldG
MTDARTAVLDRIRKAKGTSMPSQAAAGYAAIERGYQQSAQLGRAQILDLLEDRLRDYEAGVLRVAAHEVGAAAAKALHDRGIHRVLIPAGMPNEWIQGACEFVVDQSFSNSDLDSFNGVMSAATLAMAETGTIVLQNVPGQGRRAVSLVPDYHLCVLRADDVYETVVEGMRRLESTKTLPTTFFSGPSATADIEMTRIKGVHGPRFVDVLLVV